MAAGTRERIRDTTGELFRRQGYTGTGVKQIVEAAGAPFGSLYHHFPGGKEQLGEEVIRWSGGLYGQLFATIAAEASEPVAAVRAFFAGAAETLVETGFADACPIATVALEVASTNERMRLATADVFGAWVEGGATYFAAFGIAPRRARELALAMISALEGAFVLARAARSTEPLDAAGAMVAAAVAEALPA